MCAFCRQKPVYQGHPYCGKGCADMAKLAGWVDGIQQPPGNTNIKVIGKSIMKYQLQKLEKRTWSKITSILNL